MVKNEIYRCYEYNNIFIKTMKFFDKLFLEQQIKEFRKENIKKACLDLIYECTKHFAVIENGNVKNFALEYLKIYEEQMKPHIDNYKKNITVDKSRNTFIGSFLRGVPHGICFSTNYDKYNDASIRSSYGNYINGCKNGITIEKSVFNKIEFEINNYADGEIICPSLHIFFSGWYEINQTLKNKSIVFSSSPESLTISYFSERMELYIEFTYVDFKITVRECTITLLTLDGEIDARTVYAFKGNIINFTETDEECNTIEQKTCLETNIRLKNIYEDVRFRFR